MKITGALTTPARLQRLVEVALRRRTVAEVAGRDGRLALQLHPPRDADGVGEVGGEGDLLGEQAAVLGQVEPRGWPWRWRKYVDSSSPQCSIASCSRYCGHDPVVVAIEGEHAADDGGLLPGHRRERAELAASLQGDRLPVELAAEDAQAQHGDELVVAQRLGDRSDLDALGIEYLEHRRRILSLHVGSTPLRRAARCLNTATVDPEAADQLVAQLGAGDDGFEGVLVGQLEHVDLGLDLAPLLLDEAGSLVGIARSPSPG